MGLLSGFAVLAFVGLHCVAALGSLPGFSLLIFGLVWPPTQPSGHGLFYVKSVLTLLLLCCVCAQGCVVPWLLLWLTVIKRL